MSTQSGDGNAVGGALPESPPRKPPIRHRISWSRKYALIGGLIALALGLIAVAAFWASRGLQRPGELWKELPGPGAALNRLAYSPDGKYLTAGSAAGDVVVWELRDGSHRILSSFTESPITALAVSEGGFLVAGSADKHLAFLGIAGPESQAIPNFFAGVAGIAIRPYRTEIVVALADGTLCYLDESSSGRLSRVRTQHEGIAKIAAYDPQGRLLVTGGSDGRLIWRTTEPRKVQAVRDGHSGEVSALCFSADGRMLASGDWNGEIRLWNADSMEITARFLQPEAVSGIGWTRAHLVTGSWDGRLRFWSPERRMVVQEINTGRVIYDLAVSPSGDTVATVSDRNRVQLWRAPLN